MPWNPPIAPIAGTVITVPWAIANVVDPITWLRQITGGADPGAAARVLVSTGPTGTTWGLIPDAAFAAAKVQRSPPAYASFAAASVELSSFCWINNFGSISDAPIPSVLDWLLIQIRHPNTGVDYRWQMTCSLTDQDRVYHRLIVNGAGGPWRQLLHTGNVTPYLPLSGGTLSGNLTFSDSGEGVLLAGGTYFRDDTTPSTGGAQLICHQNAIRIFNATAGSVMATVTPALATFLGTVAAPRLTSTVAAGTPPLTVASSTEVPNLNAALLNGQTATQIIDAAKVPSGLIAAFANAAAIASGWSRYTAGNGRLLVGAGTAGGQTFVEGSSVGAAWTHSHSALISGNPSTTVNVAIPGTQSVAGSDHGHTIGVSSDAWIPPALTVVWAQKS